jgi:hypothetical protein
VSAVRNCRVSLRDLQGTTHSIEVRATTLFEAAAAAVAVFRQEGWGAEALTPNAMIRVEVLLPPVVHNEGAREVGAGIERQSEGTGDQDSLALKTGHHSAGPEGRYRREKSFDRRDSHSGIHSDRRLRGCPRSVATDSGSGRRPP